MTKIGNETFLIKLGTYGRGNNRAKVVKLGGDNDAIKLFYAYDNLVGIEYSIDDSQGYPTPYSLFLRDEDISRDRQRRMVHSIDEYQDMDSQLVTKSELEKHFVLVTKRIVPGVSGYVAPPDVVTIKADDEGKIITVTFDKAMNIPFRVENEFFIKIEEGEPFNPAKVTSNGAVNFYDLVLPDDKIIKFDDDVKLSYGEENILRTVSAAEDNGILGAFSDKDVDVTAIDNPNE